MQINRIDNQTLLDSYEAKREEIATEKYLWHGTSVKETPSGLVPIVNINARGFNRSYSGSSTGNNNTYNNILFIYKSLNPLIN